MKDFHANIERKYEDSPFPFGCLQQLFNHILRDILHGRISTEKEFLLQMKRRWKYLDDNQFQPSGITSFLWLGRWMKD